MKNTSKPLTQNANQLIMMKTMAKRSGKALFDKIVKLPDYSIISSLYRIISYHCTQFITVFISRVHRIISLEVIKQTNH